MIQNKYILLKFCISGLVKWSPAQHIWLCYAIVCDLLNLFVPFQDQFGQSHISAIKFLNISDEL